MINDKSKKKNYLLFTIGVVSKKVFLHYLFWDESFVYLRKVVLEGGCVEEELKHSHRGVLQVTHHLFKHNKTLTKHQHLEYTNLDVQIGILVIIILLIVAALSHTQGLATRWIFLTYFCCPF